jgi:hypothetical protein
VGELIEPYSAKPQEVWQTRAEGSTSLREDLGFDDGLIRTIPIGDRMEIIGEIETIATFDRDRCRKQSLNGVEPEMSDGMTISLSKSLQPNSQPIVGWQRQFGWDRFPVASLNNEMLMINHTNTCNSSDPQAHIKVILE